MARTSMLEAVKIQARAVIPIVRALEQEIGKERAHAIVGGAIAEAWAGVVGSRTAEPDAHPGEARGASGIEFPVESEEVENTPDSYGGNFTSCQFADYFRSIGEPEIGALLTCGVDFAVEARVRPGWEFRRSQTRMLGAAFCDFRWRKRSG